MKKYLLLASVAALAFTSCSDQSTEFVGDEAAQKAREISFAPINKPMTRSGAVTGTDFPYSMDVVAYSYVDATHKGDYFGITEFTEDTSDNVWKGTTSRYWPLSPATLNFLAVSKSNTAGATVTTTFGNTGADWASKASVVLASNYQTGAQHDLMYSFAQAAVTQSGNSLSYNSGNAVAMTFNHALAWVNFTVKAANVASEAITVNSITVNDAYYGGTFEVTVDHYDDATVPSEASYSWAVADANKATNVVPGVPAGGVSLVDTGDTGETAKSFGDGLLLVPTTGITPAKASFTNFVINYTLNGNDYDFVYTVAPTLVKGNKYFYDITFNLSEITIAPSVAPWTDGGNTPVAIPTTPAAP